MLKGIENKRRSKGIGDKRRRVERHRRCRIMRNTKLRALATIVARARSLVIGCLLKNEPRRGSVVVYLSLIHI